MPRFYLHICNGTGFAEDLDGHDYADAKAARQGAIKGIRDIMAEELRGGEINVASFIEIEDEERKLVDTVLFSEAVEVRSDPCVRRNTRR